MIKHTKEKQKAILELKKGLAKVKENATKKGWEADEVDEKVADVLEEFPWYRFNGGLKKTWKWYIWDFLLFSLIIYLAIGAGLQRNKRMKKKVMDYVFDMQIPYYHNRIIRRLCLPIFKFYDLSKFHDSECLVNNPFLEKDKMNCEFCENKTSIEVLKMDNETTSIIADGKAVVLTDVPGYANSTIGFNDVKELFTRYGEEMDSAICKIYFSEQYSKVSDFFKLTEEDIKAGNISIGWKNCDSYGARFYRKLFVRPAFIDYATEILLEKLMFFMQPGQNLLFERNSGITVYNYQIQGESKFIFSVPEDCHGDCPEKSEEVNVKAGQILVYPNTEMIASVRAVGEVPSIIYVGSYDG